MNATSLSSRTQHALTFNAHVIKTICREGQIWISTSELRQALEYADEKAVSRIFNSHADEFTATMTKVIKVTTAGGKQAVRFFSLRGAHLIAMFARTPVAKAFRVWILDVVDREFGIKRLQDAREIRLNEIQREELESLCIEVDYLNNWWKKFGPAIEMLSPKLYEMVREQFLFAAGRAKCLARDLGLKSHHKYFAEYPWWGDCTDRRLHQERCRGVK